MTTLANNLKPVDNSAKDGDLVEIARGRDRVEAFAHNRAIVQAFTIPAEQTVRFNEKQGRMQTLYALFGDAILLAINGDEPIQIPILHSLELSDSKALQLTNPGRTPAIIIATSNMPYKPDEIKGYRIVGDMFEMQEFLQDTNQLTASRIRPSFPTGNHYHRRKIERIYNIGDEDLIVLQDNIESVANRKRTIVSPREKILLPNHIAHQLSANKVTYILEVTNLKFNPENPRYDCYPHSFV